MTTMTDLYKIHNLTRFSEMCRQLADALLQAPRCATERWQSIDVQSRPEMVTRELTNVIIEMPIASIDGCREWVQPSIPWADDHFAERVSGEPLNPPPSEAWWPYAQRGNEDHKEGRIFSHTYPERFWPKYAGDGYKSMPESSSVDWIPHPGIRYDYGDLDDVVKLLQREPYTRQAYLPVWFPEDTGAVENQRVPCTLGYHFLMRQGKLNITYHIRSCDFLRHFRDDVYMAMRLCIWVAVQLHPQAEPHIRPGNLVMHVGSLHIFEGDMATLRAKVETERAEENVRFSKLVSSAL